MSGSGDGALAVELSKVSKRYRDGDQRVLAVRELSLRIPVGQLWVLEGPSGSGKTTLLGLIGGMIVPTRGELSLFGERVTSLRDRHRAELRREKVGFAFQELALIPGMSVMENLLLPLVPTGGASAEDRARAQALLARFGMSGREGSLIERLSGGQRQRVAIARALIRSPALLLLDEPTAHLDAENVREIIELLLALREEGTTLVAATHDPRLSQHPGVDRCLRMVDGELVSAPLPSGLSTGSEEEE